MTAPTIVGSTDKTFITTRLRDPRWRLLARGVWVAGVVLVLVLFVFSLTIYPSEFQSGCLCGAFTRMEQQNDALVLYPRSDGTAAGLIAAGDVLLAINDTPVAPTTSLNIISSMLDDGKIGSQVSLTVRTGNAAPRTVILTRSLPVYWIIAGAVSFGVSPDFGTLYALALAVIAMIVAVGVAGVLVWRSSDDWMALLTAWTLLAFGFTASQLLTALRITTLVPPPAFVLVSDFKAGIYTVIYTFALIFPDGRFTPRWTIALVFGFGAWQLFLRLNLAITSRILPDLVILLFLVTLIGITIYRYRRHFSALRRQQTKWALLGIGVVLLGIQLFFSITTSLSLYAPREFAVRYFFIGYPLANLVLLVVPLTFAFSMLRYRLFDVDLVINRSLVYGTVTVVMVAVFLVGGFVLQALLGQSQSGIAFAASIVVAGFLFNPARKWAQHLIDRRFYGFRFDLNELQHAQHSATIQNPGALSGRHLGVYEVLGVLGRGGMGEVYLADDGGRKVALKILPEDLAQRTEFRKRFEREAQTLAALDHPNIVKMFGAGESGGVSYMAIEFVNGRQLAEILHQRQRLSPDEIRPFVRDFAAALDYAHQHGLVHRDIKPSNIMLRNLSEGASLSYSVVLMDFGIAKIQDARTDLTGSGAIGTIDYMAPEQIMTARTVDHRADIYALGVVLYEMLTGEKPFKGSPGQVMFAHLQQPPPDPRDVNDDLPSPIAKAIMKAMAKKPEDRFQSAGELAAALVS